MGDDAAKLNLLNQFAGTDGAKEPGEVNETPTFNGRILLRIGNNTTAIPFGHNTTLSIGTSPDSSIRIPEATAPEYPSLNKGTVGHFHLHCLTLAGSDNCEFVVWVPTAHIQRGQGAYSRQTGTAQDPNPDAADAFPTYNGAFTLQVEPRDALVLYNGGGFEFRNRLQTDSTNDITITVDNVASHDECNIHQVARARKSLEHFQLNCFDLFNALKDTLRSVGEASQSLNANNPYFSQSHYNNKQTARALKDKSIKDITAGFEQWREFRPSKSDCAGATLTGTIVKFWPSGSPFAPCVEILRDSDLITPAPANDFLLRLDYRDNYFDEKSTYQPGVRVEFTPTGPFPRDRPQPPPSRNRSPGKRAKPNPGPDPSSNHHHWNFHSAEAVKAIKSISNA